MGACGGAIVSLAQKLSEIMAEVGYVQKDATNDFHHYRYASAEAVLRKVNAAVSSRGIALSSEASLEQIMPHGDGTIAVVKLGLTFTDGNEAMRVEGLGSGYDKGDKAVLKANTAALKYCLANAFLISWGDDPEADAETDVEAAQRRSVPSESQENPFGDGEIPAYAEARPIVAQMARKHGVKELRQFFGHCATKKIEWPDVVAFATEHGVDLFGDKLSLAACTKLRDMIKRSG
jgi:hypothetical protein